MSIPDEIFGLEMHKNAFVDGALPRILLGELTHG